MNIVQYHVSDGLYAIRYRSRLGEACDLVAKRVAAGHFLYRLMYPRQPLVPAERLPNQAYIDAAHAFEKFLVLETLG